MILLERSTVGEVPVVFINATHWLEDGSDIVFYKPGSYLGDDGVGTAKAVFTVPSSEVVTINGEALSP